MAYRQPLDIYNRALQHCGVKRLSAIDEPTAGAAEIGQCYDDLRGAEIEANTWGFAIKRVRLRAATATTQLFAPSVWAAATTYTIGQIVSFANYNWVLVVASSTGDQPDTSSNWEHYWGSLTADTYDSTQTYELGELAVGSNASVYAAIIASTTADPTVSADWVLLAGTKAAYKILVPLTVGTSGQQPYYAFRLPDGFLRRAPADPKRGRLAILGAPSGNWADDYLFESGMLLARQSIPLTLRFVADIWSVTAMHPMFCEALSARIATEVCGSVVEKERVAEVRAACERHYRSEIYRARIADALIQGPVQPSVDEYITCRY